MPCSVQKHGRCGPDGPGAGLRDALSKRSSRVFGDEAGVEPCAVEAQRGSQGAKLAWSGACALEE